MAVCKLCDGVIACKRPGRDVSICNNKASVPADGCWLNTSPSLKESCAKSLLARPVAQFEERAHAFRVVGEAIDKSDLHLRSAIAQLSKTQLYELMHYAAPDIKVRLSPLMVELGIQTLQPPDIKVEIPEDIHESLRPTLLAYKSRLETRLSAVRKRGGNRSNSYIKEQMMTPFRLARFLGNHGITSWEAMRKRDIVAFIAENPNVKPTILTRLLRALSENKPFAERRGSKVGGRRASRPSPLQEVLSPAEVNTFLVNVKARYTLAEFIAAWLVAKLGMSAAAVYRLTADRLKMDVEGRVVIRPAMVWVILPKSVATIISSIADSTAPGWRNSPDNGLAHVPLFGNLLPDIDDFRKDALNSDACRLRASAVYAALLSGHQDRVTLHQTMGVSHTTIASIERHLSIDLHRKLDPALVKKRNQKILGHENG